MLVTGAEGALGAVVARRFLKSGCEVLATYHQSHSQEKSGLQWTQVDVADPVSIKKAIFGKKIDALIHCAGGFRFSNVDEFKDGDLDFLINANLKSAFYLVREILPGMKQRNFGRIVFVSAKMTLNPIGGMGLYSASKAGLNMLTASLAEEVKAYDITVNSVLPSLIDTPANRKEMPKADFSKWVSPESLAEIIFALTQSVGAPVHGALIPVTGRV